MKLSILDSKHPCYDADRWCQVDALVKGGKWFKQHIGTFLPQNPVEPDDVYVQRRAQAHYRSYTGSIINLYVGWLFASSFSIKPFKRGTETPIENVNSFYGAFQENVGAETKLSAFMEGRFRSALGTGCSVWLAELPSNNGVVPETAKDFETRGLGSATLKALDPEDLFDFELADDGSLAWANVHTLLDTRSSWLTARGELVETWKIYDRETVRTFQMTYKKGERPRDPNYDVSEIENAVPHGFKRVPVIRMAIPTELTIGEQTFDTQLEHFRQDNALSWLIRRTCYAQPIFNLEDGDRPPTMGAGYAIVIGPDDKMGWTSPPVAPFDVLQNNVDSKRDEIYRIVHQMAQGLDNNAETVGRSADSKEIDAAATRILLNAYGELVSRPIEETLELISEARNETDYEWSVEGFSGYDTATVGSLIGNAKEARALGIPSQKFHQEICTKTALALLPEVDQRVKDTIRAEIAAATFSITTDTLESAQAANLEAQAKLNDAKAAAEPIKAKAAMKSAARPAPKPGQASSSPRA